MDSSNDKKTYAAIEGLSEALNDIKKEDVVICTPNETEEDFDSFWDYDPYSKFSEMYPDDWERMMQRKSSEELKYDEERLCNESVLKCWIMDNPEKAKIWYTLFLNSRTDISAQDLDSFIKILGTDDIMERRLLTDKYRNFYTREEKADPWCQCHDGVYYHWKGWIEEYEEYQEFKSKAPEDWQRFVWSINAEDVMRTIGYDGSQMENIIENNYCCGLGTYRAYELLKKWSSDNKSLWEDIILNYTAEKKDDDTYLVQAWLDHFKHDEDFKVWRIKNPKLWCERKQWDSNKLYEEMTRFSLYYDQDTLLNLWKKEYIKSWESWSKRNQKYWQERFEEHRTLLWYVYTESVWTEYCQERDKSEEYKCELIGDAKVDNNILENEMFSEDIDGEEYLDDLFEMELEPLFLRDYHFPPCVPHDPRNQNLC